jgi:acyl-CoA thioesterase-1
MLGALGALAAALVAGGVTGAARAAEPRTLLVLGDSLSAEYGLARGSGWVALLERRIAERGLAWRVINASISGETTSGGRARLPDLLARHAPALVVIELGGNDALRGLPLAGTEANLREMVLASRKAGARPVVFGMQMPPNYGRAYAEQFAGLFRRVAESEKALLLPFFLAPIADRIEAFQPDRIHPTAQAQPQLLDTAWTVLAPLLGAR